MEPKYWLQYRSVNLLWYDSSPYLTLDEAMDAYDICLANRPKGSYRVIERTDKVVWPIDPASQGGA